MWTTPAATRAASPGPETAGMCLGSATRARWVTDWAAAKKLRPQEVLRPVLATLGHNAGTHPLASPQRAQLGTRNVSPLRLRTRAAADAALSPTTLGVLDEAEALLCLPAGNALHEAEQIQRLRQTVLFERARVSSKPPPALPATLSPFQPPSDVVRQSPAPPRFTTSPRASAALLRLSPRCSTAFPAACSTAPVGTAQNGVPSPRHNLAPAQPTGPNDASAMATACLFNVEKLPDLPPRENGSGVSSSEANTGAYQEVPRAASDATVSSLCRTDVAPSCGSLSADKQSVAVSVDAVGRVSDVQSACSTRSEGSYYRNPPTDYPSLTVSSHLNSDVAGSCDDVSTQKQEGAAVSLPSCNEDTVSNASSGFHYQEPPRPASAVTVPSQPACGSVSQTASQPSNGSQFSNVSSGSDGYQAPNGSRASDGDQFSSGSRGSGRPHCEPPRAASDTTAPRKPEGVGVHQTTSLPGSDGNHCSGASSGSDGYRVPSGSHANGDQASNSSQYSNRSHYQEPPPPAVSHVSSHCRTDGAPSCGSLSADKQPAPPSSHGSQFSNASNGSDPHQVSNGSQCSNRSHYQEPPPRAASDATVSSSTDAAPSCGSLSADKQSVCVSVNAVDHVSAVPSACSTRSEGSYYRNPPTDYPSLTVSSHLNSDVAGSCGDVSTQKQEGAAVSLPSSNGSQFSNASNRSNRSHYQEPPRAASDTTASSNHTDVAPSCGSLSVDKQSVAVSVDGLGHVSAVPSACSTRSEGSYYRNPPTDYPSLTVSGHLNSDVAGSCGDVSTQKQEGAAVSLPSTNGSQFSNASNGSDTCQFSSQHSNRSHYQEPPRAASDTTASSYHTDVAPSCGSLSADKQSVAVSVDAVGRVSDVQSACSTRSEGSYYRNPPTDYPSLTVSSHLNSDVAGSCDDVSTQKQEGAAVSLPSSNGEQFSRSSCGSNRSHYQKPPRAASDATVSSLCRTDVAPSCGSLSADKQSVAVSVDGLGHVSAVPSACSTRSEGSYYRNPPTDYPSLTVSSHLNSDVAGSCGDVSTQKQEGAAVSLPSTNGSQFSNARDEGQVNNNSSGSGRPHDEPPRNASDATVPSRPGCSQTASQPSSNGSDRYQVTNGSRASNEEQVTNSSHASNRPHSQEPSCAASAATVPSKPGCGQTASQPGSNGSQLSNASNGSYRYQATNGSHALNEEQVANSSHGSGRLHYQEPPCAASDATGKAEGVSVRQTTSLPGSDGNHCSNISNGSDGYRVANNGDQAGNSSQYSNRSHYQVPPRAASDATAPSKPEGVSVCQTASTAGEAPGACPDTILNYPSVVSSHVSGEAFFTGDRAEQKGGRDLPLPSDSLRDGLFRHSAGKPAMLSPRAISPRLGLDPARSPQVDDGARAGFGDVNEGAHAAHASEICGYFRRAELLNAPLKPSAYVLPVPTASTSSQEVFTWLLTHDGGVFSAVAPAFRGLTGALLYALSKEDYLRRSPTLGDALFAVIHGAVASLLSPTAPVVESPNLSPRRRAVVPHSAEFAALPPVTPARSVGPPAAPSTSRCVSPVRLRGALAHVPIVPLVTGAANNGPSLEATSLRAVSVLQSSRDNLLKMLSHPLSPASMFSPSKQRWVGETSVLPPPSPLSAIVNSARAFEVTG